MSAGDVSVVVTKLPLLYGGPAAPREAHIGNQVIDDLHYDNQLHSVTLMVPDAVKDWSLQLIYQKFSWRQASLIQKQNRKRLSRHSQFQFIARDLCVRLAEKHG
jgi:hypothetical protein